MECTAAATNLGPPLACLGGAQSRKLSAPSHASWILPASLKSFTNTPLSSSAHSPALRCRSGQKSIKAVMGGVPPRHCTLREFGDGVDDSQLMLRPIRVRASNGSGEAPQATVLELIAANAEASAQVSSFETVAGRAAMMGFLMATVDESVTGTSLFQGIEMDTLVPFLMLLAAVCAAAGSAALAWQASNHVAGILQRGCRNIVDTAVDSIIEGLFFESSDAQAWDSEQKQV